ncbi:OmpH family outer membrane protein [Sediminibacterium soli]|uniref:OmpH family outer membrane protein n=1 Tax=Sediminibacterium soli TaxID=2698829 RepID=UPI00137A2B71|nr:OmpH family outer membrane protein [Sediminibacterium soli]NCI47791.1 OmpH family outer membrane protein [Sediminibacterium soli]
MKKFLFVCVAVVASMLLTKNTNAQAVKIGYFDEESVLSAFPDIAKIDSLINIFRRDSLGGEFQYRMSEFQRADSAFKKDSAALPAKARELALQDLNQKRYYLVNWNQIGQQMSDAKLEQLLEPYRRRIAEAMKAVVAEGKYTLVLNQAALAPAFYAQPPLSDNLTLRVAIKLKLPIPKEVEDAFRAATGGGAAPVKK